MLAAYYSSFSVNFKKFYKLLRVVLKSLWGLEYEIC
jgi:hypothetical protein